jgi:hypothetical protein
MCRRLRMQAHDRANPRAVMQPEPHDDQGRIRATLGAEGRLTASEIDIVDPAGDLGIGLYAHWDMIGEAGPHDTSSRQEALIPGSTNAVPPHILEPDRVKWQEAELCQAAMLSTILPRLCGAPASISWAKRASSSGSTVPTSVTSFPLSNSAVILSSRAVVTST